MDKALLTEILEKHQKWLNDKDGGERANLRGADLQYAVLREADLDFSCWPLWCGSLGVKGCKRLFVQLVYHICRLDVDDEECRAAQKMLAPLANQFHRVDECGRIEVEEEAAHEPT